VTRTELARQLGEIAQIRGLQGQRAEARAVQAADRATHAQAEAQRHADTVDAARRQWTRAQGQQGMDPRLAGAWVVLQQRLASTTQEHERTTQTAQAEAGAALAVLARARAMQDIAAEQARVAHADARKALAEKRERLAIEAPRQFAREP
jgi:hypothetical protein